MRVLRRLLVFALLSVFLLVLAGGAGAVYVLRTYGQGLPDYRQLADYAPPTVTRIHAGDGRLLAEYATEKRVFVPVSAMPKRLVQAFLSAEDKAFYQHPGVDYRAIARAVWMNVDRLRGNLRPVGASTITQQVAKNFLLSSEVSLDRKIREILLAFRIERAFTKNQILELYLNEIYLGMGSYGVAAAALNYFNKSLDDLTTAEMAFLAALPKAPANYHPRRNPGLAKGRRDWVLGRMHEDGVLTREELAAAQAEPIVLRGRSPTEFFTAEYFAEEVRRELAARYGEGALYRGGLSVRTTLSPHLQTIADRALRDGLSAYDRRRGWRGPLARIDPGDGDSSGDWADSLARQRPPFDPGHWQLAVVLAVDDAGARIGLDGGEEARLPLGGMTWARPVRAGGAPGPDVTHPAQVVERGDVVLVERVTRTDGEERFELRQVPEVEGAVVVLDPHRGRVLALSGGFDYRRSEFNRAVQARRQPGSAFKPFVYLAALEAGMTPSDIMLDAPIVVDQGPGLEEWRPTNYDSGFHGPSTLRRGIERSRNVMTVRLAQGVGMDAVADVARRFDLTNGAYMPLSASLGALEVTVLDLTAAYAMLVNGGKRIEPVLIERIQDRRGRTIARRDLRSCDGCTAGGWNGQRPPPLPDTREQVADPRHAYQMVHMLQGVVERGTGRQAAQLGVPVAGKTGTTNETRDAWFIGFTPDLVVGVFVGFDQPRPLGARETGASVALPIFTRFMRDALADEPPTPFRIPPGVRLVRVDAETGLLPSPDSETVILEAFLPGTEPTRVSPARGQGWGQESFDDDWRRYLPDTVSEGAPSRPRPSPQPPPSAGGLY